MPRGNTKAIADMLAQLRQWDDELKRRPAPVWRIVARHDVPYGRCFKYYDTKGRLIVYANRGEIADLPQRPVQQMFGPDAPIANFGIPVVVE